MQIIIREFAPQFAKISIFLTPVNTGSDIMSLTACADDQNVALFHNQDVKEQRVDFYCYHMSQGWPASVPLDL